MPHRHRPHLHGRRLAGGRRQGSRDHAARRDPGLVGQHAARTRDHRRSGCGHLRHRRRREGQTAIRRQTAGRIRSQTGDQRARQDGRRSAGRRNQSQRRTRRRLCRRGRGGRRIACVRRGRLGYPHPADPAHRRQLHDPLRRRGRSAHRAGLPVRRLRDRQHPRRWLEFVRKHVRAQQLADESSAGRIHDVPRCGAVHARRARIQLPGTGTRGLHIVRHCRPAGPGARIHGGRGRGLRGRRLHRRHRRRCDRRLLRRCGSAESACRSGSGA